MGRIPRLLPLIVVLAACGHDAAPPDPGGTPVVVATLPPIGSLVRAVGQGAVRVRTLLPPGAHADGFEAMPRMAEALAAAALVVRVGEAADAWLGRAEGVPTLNLTDGIRLRGERGAGTGNPHVWLDPVLVRDRLLPRLVDAVSRVQPDSAAAIRARGSAYADSLTALDEEIRTLLAGAASRAFVAAHPAWLYFADRYGLQQIGVLHPSPGAELTVREMARLVDEARAAGVTAVIAEPQLGRAGVGAIADELGAVVELADPLGGEGVDDRGDYLALMRFNARAFARALGGP
jgi:zinc transport system substrate-binding protein